MAASIVSENNNKDDQVESKHETHTNDTIIELTVKETNNDGSSKSSNNDSIQSKIEEAGNDGIRWDILKGNAALSLILLSIHIVVYLVVYFGIDASYAINSQFYVSFILFFINFSSFLNIGYYYLEKDGTTLKTKSKFGKLTYLNDKIGMIRPAISHFVDTASDISVLIEFYQTDEYYDYFKISLFIIIFHRVVSSLIIYNFSKNWFNFILQLFDFYILKIVKLNIENKYDSSSEVQGYIQFLEALFEAAPQLLISFHIILTSNDEVSFAIIVSFLFSFSTIVNRCVSEDSYFFVESFNSKFRELNFQLEKDGCCKYCFSFNWYYVYRFVLRLLDVFGWFLCLSLFWIVRDGSEMIVFLFLLLVISMWYPLFNVCLGNSFDIFLFNALLQTPIGGAYAHVYALTRIVIEWVLFLIICLSVDYKRYNVLLFVLLICILSSHLYVLFEPYICLVNSCCNCNCNCCCLSLSSFATSLSTTSRSLSMCTNMDDVNRLLAFEYKIRESQIQDRNTWRHFDDPLKLIEFLKDENTQLKHNYKWNNIKFKRSIVVILFENDQLSQYNREYWNKLFEIIELKNHVNDVWVTRTCVEYQHNIELIKLLIEEYDFKVNDDINVLSYAKRNQTENRNEIMDYLQTKK